MSCNSDKEDIPTLDLSESSFGNIENKGATLSVEIYSNSKWYIANSANWCIPDKLQGHGNHTLSLRITPNKEQAQRKVTLIISTDGINKTIEISQQKGDLEIDVENIHYQLPVIFHVLYKDREDENQYIQQGHLSEILKQVNRYYQKANCGVDMNLEFIPATEDANGNLLLEPGVERIQWDSKTIDCEIFMNNHTGVYTHLLWEPNNYINIMIYPFTDDRILGISTFPYTPKDYYLEGTTEVSSPWLTLENLKFAYCISINSSYIYEQSIGGKLNQNDAAITLAHEIGHFLGLRHIFSEGGSPSICKDTDFCKDTPTYNRSEYEQWLNGLDKNEKYSLTFLAKRYDCSTGGFEAHNFMDYAYCLYDEFSPEQRNRVRYILNHSPLIPGPKKWKTDKTTRTTSGLVDLPICVMQ